MKNQDLAKAILDHIGKEENIKNLTHCVTRLRFTLKDRKKADVKYIEQLEGVLGVQEQNGQFRHFQKGNLQEGLSGTYRINSFQ